MTTLENFVSPALTRALGWTLLHSLWQGALVAAVLAGALLLLRRQRAELRYVASAGALGVVVALAGLTFGLYFNAGTGQGSLRQAGAGQVGWGDRLRQPAGASAAEVTALAGSATGRLGRHAEAGTPPKSVLIATQESQSGSVAPALRRSLAAGLRYFDQHLPLLVVAWLLGLLAMSLRMAGGLLYVQRLRRYRVRPLSAGWQERLAELAVRSGVRRPVALLESALVQVPLVVGHLRPVILLPLGTVAGLSPAYLEAILAHELAHVLRRDYLVNLLQTVAEVLFFYHPAVWFVAGCVRTERENCCDDTATALVGGDPLRLARALTALAEWTQSAVVPTAPRLALAAIGKRGELLNRVRRLVQRRPAPPTLAEGIMAGVLVLGGLGLLGSSVVLARPLAQPVMPAAFNWQTGPSKVPAPAPADTTKRVAGTTTTPTTTTSPAPGQPGQPGQVRPEVTATQDGPDSEGPGGGRRSRRDRETRREMGPRPFPAGPSTVVITKDKKGRLTNLVVNGQPVEAATAKVSKADRRAGRQVTVATLPPAPSDWNFNFDYSRSLDDKMAKSMDKRARDFDRKMDRKMDKAAQKMDKAGGPYVYATPRNGRLDDNDIHIEINDEALNRLANNAVALGNIGLNIGLQAAAQGLEEARRSLEATLRNPNLDAETRRATKQALADMKRGTADNFRRPERPERLERPERPERLEAPERPEIRERAEDLRNRRQELQDRIRESQQELRDLEQDRADSEQDRADSNRDRADRSRDRADRSRDHNEALVAKMQQDGLLKDKDHYQVKLTARSLVIDGKEQPQKVFQKYLQLYESSNGRKLSGNNAMVITRSSDSSTIINNDGPTPPQPPQLPRVPRTPRLAPVAPPAPPRPPRAPSVDTETLRDELRKDGVIGRNEKDFQFQLNNAGLTVNGKKQSDDLAARYRKLTGHDSDKAFNMTISTQE